jgi:hypothetical protein
MRKAIGIGTAVLLAVFSGCGENLYAGSDVLWAALHEGGNFDEWVNAGGGANATNQNSVVVSNEQAHHGIWSAKLSIGNTTGAQQDAVLVLRSAPTSDGYFSAWYYLPQPVNVGVFWVIMKFRMRLVADDPTTSQELYDLNLRTLMNGTMSLRLYDHRMGIGDVVFQKPDPPIPVGKWFQIEAYYRNAPDNTGRFTLWLDGDQVLDVSGKAMGPSPWVGWEASSIGQNLTPNAAVLYIDDAAISETRVGPAGVIAR